LLLIALKPNFSIEPVDYMKECSVPNPASSSDIISTSFVGAQKAYDVIFVPKQKRKLFPIFKKTPAESLKSKIAACIVVI
jgi:hypothetical protein